MLGWLLCIVIYLWILRVEPGELSVIILCVRPDCFRWPTSGGVMAGPVGPQEAHVLHAGVEGVAVHLSVHQMLVRPCMGGMRGPELSVRPARGSCLL